MYNFIIEDKLEEILKKLYRKNRKTYEIIMKKIEEIIKLPQHYKSLRYDMKNVRRVHIEKSFVLIFNIDEESKTVKFIDYDHHDNIYKK